VLTRSSVNSTKYSAPPAISVPAATAMVRM
jgi:hypothetical protein